MYIPLHIYYVSCYGPLQRASKNNYTMIKNFTQRGYRQVCGRAQNCYNDLFKALKNGNDCSWMWEIE